MAQIQDTAWDLRLAQGQFKRGKYRAACVAFAKVIETGVNRAEAHRGWGDALAALANYEEAVGHYEAAIQDNPTDDNTYNLWRTALNKLKTPEIAIARLQMIIDCVKDPAAHAQWGALLFELGRHQTAAAEYQKAAPDKNADPKLHVQWGRALAALNQHAEAVDHYQTAIQQGAPDIDAMSFGLLADSLTALGTPQPLVDRLQTIIAPLDRPEAHIWWAEALYRLGRFREATVEYEKTLSKTPDNVAASIGWGRALAALGNLDAAIVQFGATITSGSMAERPSRLSNALKNLPHPELAIARLQKVLDQVDMPQAYGVWGSVLTDLGHYTQAVVEYEKAARDPMDNAWMYVQWGRALAALGQHTQAAWKYIAAIVKDASQYNDLLPNAFSCLSAALQSIQALDLTLTSLQGEIDRLDTPKIYVQWGDLLADHLRRYAAATSEYKKATVKEPDNHLTYHQWGRALAALGRHAEAVIQYQTAIQKAPAVFSGFSDDLIRSLEQIKAREPIMAELQQIVASTDNASIDLIWGQVLHRLGDYEAAARQYDRAALKDPEDPWPHVHLGHARTAQGRHVEAISSYERAITLSSGGHALNAACNALVRPVVHLDDDESTIKGIQAKIDAIDGAYAYYSWANVLSHLGRHGAALEQFHRAVEKNATDARLCADFGVKLIMADRHQEGLAQHKYAADGTPEDSYVHDEWGVSLLRLRQYEDAIDKCRRATELGDAGAYFNWALALGKLGFHQAAIDQYEKCITEKKDDLVLVAYARHNIAYTRREQGEYIDAGKAREVALQAYEKAISQARDYANADFFMYLGSVHEIRQDFPEAEKQYVAGLALNPKHTGLLAALMKLHLYKKEHALRDDQAPEPSTESHWKAWDAYQKARKLLDRQVKELPTASIMLELGLLHFNMGEHEQAEGLFLKALATDSDAPDLYEALGTVCLRIEKFKDALKYFKGATDRDPQNLAFRSKLAEAYLKNNVLDKAEIEYKSVLGVAPNHVDALIGLGNVYTAFGDDLFKNGKFSDAESMFRQAIDHFTQAVSVADLDSGLRRLTPVERAATSHSRGYANVMCYEAQTLTARDQKLLEAALRDFRIIPRKDSNYHKAQRNISKIEERIRPSTLSPARWGAWLITIAAGLIFIGSQVVFYGGKPGLGKTFQITEQSLKALQALQVPDDVVQKLNPLTKDELRPWEAFNRNLKAKLGDKEAAQFGDTIRQHASSPMLRWQEPLETGYYVLLTFGSLLFMISGLYLQQLSKLKVGAIELEKTSEALTKISGSLGITK